MIGGIQTEQSTAALRAALKATLARDPDALDKIAMVAGVSVEKLFQFIEGIRDLTPMEHGCLAGLA